jgi:hypothetical protein
VSAQQPVPGIIRAGGSPAPTSRSRRSSFSPSDIEFASELVPNTASPTSFFNSQRQCRARRSASGFRLLSNGVTTGDRTPRSFDS